MALVVFGQGRKSFPPITPLSSSIRSRCARAASGLPPAPPRFPPAFNTAPVRHAPLTKASVASTPGAQVAVAAGRRGPEGAAEIAASHKVLGSFPRAPEVVGTGKGEPER